MVNIGGECAIPFRREPRGEHRIYKVVRVLVAALNFEEFGRDYIR